MTSLIENFGALGVFLLMVPESACIPIPSEVTLIFSGVAVHQGWMSFPLALLAATAGNLVGSLLAYGLGASGLLAGVPVVGAVLGRWEGLIDRHGTRAVLSARLMPLARTFVSLPAGARRVPLGSFVALTTLGCAVWALAFILVGLLAGAAWAEVSTVLGRVLLAVGLLALAYTVLHGRERRKRVP
ncbi:MAG TPA: DedA family protein [Solirubrobacteraceae bacterium]|nr:DedA family protein [Solirubrobacteraceae bacterium]